MPFSEGDLLRPADPSISNSDDWEIFVLSNAHVVYECNGKPASLLSAYADTPLKIQGRLEGPGRGQIKYFLKKPYKPADIEIRNVTRFSYGETTDGSYVLWAQGKSGWFEIQPAAHYESIFNDMVEAVELLYFVTDIYGERRKKAGGPSAALVFKEYAQDERFECSDPALAEQIFNRHHVFLMMCFLNRDQTVGWTNTALYKHFRSRYPKDFETCKARIEGRDAKEQSKQDAPPSKSTSVDQSKSTTTAPKTTTNRSKTVDSKPSAPPKKDNNWWEAAALFEFIQKAVNQRVLRPGKNFITLKRVAELVVKRYEIEELEVAQNVLLVHARNLCYMMDHPRRKSIRFFASEPIYQELLAGHNLSATEQRKTESVELRPRKDHATLRDGDVSSSDTPDEEEEDVVMTPVRRLPGYRRRGRLSVMRPSGSKYSGKSKGKGKGGKGKAPFPHDQDALSDHSESHNTNESNSSSDADMDMDTPTHVFSPGREKRKFDETDVDEEEEQGRRKRNNSASGTPNSPPTSADSEEEEEGAAVVPLPLRYSSTHGLSSSSKQNKLVATLVTEPLPTYTSNGPRNSWICSFDGCSQRIYGCSKPRGQQLITEHLDDHTKGREKVVGILWREQDKLNLPVNNLIKKIRELTEASEPLFPDSTTEKVMPQPIRRPV